MCLIVLSVMIVSICKTMSLHHSITDTNYIAKSRWIILLPIAIVFINCILLTLASYIARESKKIGYSALQFVADFSLIAGVIYLCGFFYQQFYSQPFTISLTLYMMIAGLFLTLAFVFLNAAILSGKGALAISITQTQSFFWLLLEILISLRVPHAYEIVAMGVGITGACIIAKK